ncbi:low affinity immunoglobulin gamma Fc region receptor II-like isoform X2 [Mugil cephalus]|uniref:low affinity immunoglobulin gamma Fc region receptor II-like isoform X2 n=1 Tax=Mugil cephalus TaxID=48193 RepID=UPI001FB6BFEF|nr:low affinity immunoglobulin gamma Fc region receptor II-like isoform X2 [Mugil cephalus]
MEVRAFCITLLTAMILLCAQDQEVNAAFLRTSPNRLQFFEFESVTFYCEGVFYCDVEHKSIGAKPSCCTTNNKTFRGPTCTIKNFYRDDSGKYWCQEGGERRNIININVVYGSVILESPALPVMEGEDVTLSCRTRKSSSNIQADFYKDGVHKWRSSTGNLNLKSVLMSDQGLYKCNISGVGESPQSWLSIGALLFSSPYFYQEMNLTSFCKCNETLTEHCSSPDPNSHICPILKTTFTIIMVLVLLLLLLGCLYCVLDRRIKHDSSPTDKKRVFCYFKAKRWSG